MPHYAMVEKKLTLGQLAASKICKFKAIWCPSGKDFLFRSTIQIVYTGENRCLYTVNIWGKVDLLIINAH